MERFTLEDTTANPHLFGSLDATHVSLPTAIRTGRLWCSLAFRLTAYFVIVVLDVLAGVWLWSVLH
jgi:hypothetical protein